MADMMADAPVDTKPETAIGSPNTDDVHSQVTLNNPKTPGTELRQLSGSELRNTEIPSEVYAEHFDALQIKPAKWDDFFTHVVKLVRNKHVGDLKRGTVASIRNLNFVLLRGYGMHVWQEPKSKQWLRELEDGEVRVEYEKGGDNER